MSVADRPRSLIRIFASRARFDQQFFLQAATLGSTAVCGNRDSANGDHHDNHQISRFDSVLPHQLRPSLRGSAAATGADPGHRQRHRSALSRPEQQPLHGVPGDARGHHHERSDQSRLLTLAQGRARVQVQGAGALRALHAQRLGSRFGRRRLRRHGRVRRPSEHAGFAGAASRQSAADRRRREDGREPQRARRTEPRRRGPLPSVSPCSTTTATTW